jgi:hypothetical protein
MPWRPGPWKSDEPMAAAFARRAEEQRPAQEQKSFGSFYRRRIHQMRLEGCHRESGS